MKFRAVEVDGGVEIMPVAGDEAAPTTRPDLCPEHGERFVRFTAASALWRCPHGDVWRFGAGGWERA